MSPSSLFAFRYSALRKSFFGHMIRTSWYKSQHITRNTLQITYDHLRTWLPLFRSQFRKTSHAGLATYLVHAERYRILAGSAFSKATTTRLRTLERGNPPLPQPSPSNNKPQATVQHPASQHQHGAAPEGKQGLLGNSGTSSRAKLFGMDGLRGGGGCLCPDMPRGAPSVRVDRG